MKPDDRPSDAGGELATYLQRIDATLTAAQEQLGYPGGQPHPAIAPLAARLVAAIPDGVIDGILQSPD